MKRFICLIALMLGPLAMSCSHTVSRPDYTSIQPAPATQPTAFTIVALLVDPQSNAANVAAALGHHFRDQPGIAVVERPTLDQSLEQQRVEGSLAPDAARGLLHLPEPLQADILVLLNDDKQFQDHIDLVACETHHGFRLLSATIPATGDPTTDAAAVQQCISKAIAKSRQDIRRVFAVPSMACSDLARDRSSLGSTYSSMIEDALSSRDGQFVVELGQTRAIQHELQLGSRNTIHRPMPTYIFGRYAHHDSGNADAVTFTLTARQGGESGPIESVTALPSNLPASLVSAADKLLGWHADAGLAGPDPKTEAAILAERGRLIEHSGDISDAVNLYDASLLLNPDQLQFHYDIIALLNRIRLPGDRGDAADFYRQSGDQILAIRERQLEHLQLWLAGARFGPKWRVGIPPEGDAYVAGIPDRFRNTALAIDRARRGVYFSVMDARAQAGQTDFYSDMPSFLIGIGSPEESYQVRLRAIRLLKDSPRARQLITFLTWFKLSPAEMREPSYQHFLADAAKIDGTQIAAAIDDARKNAQRMAYGLNATRPQAPGARTWATVPRPLPPGIQPIQPPQRPPIPSEVHLPQGTPRAVFHPLKLSVFDEQGHELNPIQSIGPSGSWLPIGQHFDVVTDDNALYVMKEKGKLQELFFGPDRAFYGCQPSFDGRYLWAPIRVLDKGQVLVIDPDKGIVARFTQADGLPEISQQASAAGLEPGHACVAGSSGPGWIASLRYDPQGGKRLHVFFDAKFKADPGSIFGKQKLQSAFNPGRIYVLRGKATDGKPLTRLIIERSCSPFPLLVDPTAETVTIFDQDLLSGEMDTDPTVENGQLFKSEGTGESSARVERYALPDLKPVKVGELPASIPTNYPMTFFDGRFHVLAAEHWQTADSPSGPYTEFAGVLPGHYTRILLHSNFYGLIINTEDPVQGLYAVELPQRH